MAENEQAVAVREQGEIVRSESLSLKQVTDRVNLVHEVLKKVMKVNTHYGTVPGCGTKMVLLKPGADVLAMTFRLVPQFKVERTDLENGHREFDVTCSMFNPSGELLGQGVGSASTMEKKYRYRKDSSGNKIENEDIADVYNCVTPDTKILTHDLRWVAAGDIETGDKLIGVDENLTDQYGRKIAVGEATVYGVREDQVYKLTFDDGRSVRCNGEHQWLVKKVGLKGTEWVSAQEIYREVTERVGRPRQWTVMSFCKPWDEEHGWDAGYVAGLLDADGSLAMQQLMVMFAQQDNIVLARIEAALESRGYSLGKSACKTKADLAGCESQKQVYGLRVLGGIGEQLRLMGTIRPPRLLERWNRFDLSARRLEGSGS